jgi:hypothetical protein
MTRREYIENIIIGTLLDYSGGDYYQDCKCSITEDMIQDETNKRIFHLICDMRKKCKAMTTPLDLYEEYGFMIEDMVADMCEKCNEYSFIHLKTEYNENRFIQSCITGEKYKRTDVQFTDYVNQYLKLSYEQN